MDLNAHLELELDLELEVESDFVFQIPRLGFGLDCFFFFLD